MDRDMVCSATRWQISRHVAGTAGPDDRIWTGPNPMGAGPMDIFTVEPTLYQQLPPYTRLTFSPAAYDHSLTFSSLRTFSTFDFVSFLDGLPGVCSSLSCRPTVLPSRALVVDSEKPPTISGLATQVTGLAWAGIKLKSLVQCNHVMQHSKRAWSTSDLAYCAADAEPRFHRGCDMTGVIANRHGGMRREWLFLRRSRRYFW